MSISSIKGEGFHRETIGSSKNNTKIIQNMIQKINDEIYKKLFFSQEKFCYGKQKILIILQQCECNYSNKY